MNIGTNLTAEETIVLLCSRNRLSEAEYEELRGLLAAKPDFGAVFRLAVYNKTMGLVSKHILHFGTDAIPGLFRRQLLFMNLGNRERNREMFRELAAVLAMLNASGIQYSPLKGAYLIPYIYQDMSVRLSNDIDILIRQSDVEKVCSIMKDAGYIMGTYDDPTRSVIPAKRRDDIYWKTQVGNIHPFVKISDNPFLDFLVVDYAFDVDPVHRNTRIAEDMLENTVVTEIVGTQTRLLHPTDFLIQVCTHLYKEACARHAAEETHADLNLIKFCDVRELVLAQWDLSKPEQTDELAARAKHHHVENALYYCFECCKGIYGDDFWDGILQKLTKTPEPFEEPLTPDREQFWDSMFRRQG